MLPGSPPLFSFSRGFPCSPSAVSSIATLYSIGQVISQEAREGTDKGQSGLETSHLGETIPIPNTNVVVSDHRSMADIPLISNLPWEIKWMGKLAFFRLPVIEWMMQLSGNISVDRKKPHSGALALIKAQRYFERKCSVIIFPEGNRILNGRVRQFTDGAFHLAIHAKDTVLPMVIEGSRDCIPKNSWQFGEPSRIFLKILPPINTASLTIGDCRLCTIAYANPL